MTPTPHELDELSTRVAALIRSDSEIDAEIRHAVGYETPGDARALRPTEWMKDGVYLLNFLAHRRKETLLWSRTFHGQVTIGTPDRFPRPMVKLAVIKARQTDAITFATALVVAMATLARRAETRVA